MTGTFALIPFGRRPATLVILLGFFSIRSTAQVDSSKISAEVISRSVSDRALNSVDVKYSDIQQQVERQSQKAIQQMEKREGRLYEIMRKKDSTKAEQLFSAARAKYARLTANLRNGSANPPTSLYREYFPSLDSIQTVMKFLPLSSTMHGATVKLQKIQLITSKMQLLENTMQNANQIQAFISQREQQLKSQLTRYELASKLIGINKQAYYYQQQMATYKGMLNDKQKLEQTLLADAQQFPGFVNFWQKNSYFSQFFPANTVNGVILPQSGLQQKSQTSEMIAKQLNSSTQGGGGSSISAIQSQIAQAKIKLQSMKEHIQHLDPNSGWNSNMTTPDFSPNSQHSKKFLHRLKFGFNIQNNAVTNYLPSISTIGLMLGYRLNDKIIFGVGGSYLLGLGNGIQDIHLSNQGVGLRSFIDIKAKGSLWITGGYEYSYLQGFTKFSAIKNFDTWQKGALLGITKKYLIGGKQANIQLLYNFLYKTNTSDGSPLIFRIGYSL